MFPGAHHPFPPGLVFLMLLCNCVSLLASPAPLSDWPKLHIFGKSAPGAPPNRATNRSPTSTPTDQQHENTSRSSPFSSRASLSASSFSSSSTSSSVGCFGCRSRKQVNGDDASNQTWSSSMSTAERDYRVEVFKRKILDALELPDPPDMTRDMPKLSPEMIDMIISESDVKDNDHDHEEEKKDSFKTDRRFILGTAGGARGYANAWKTKFSFIIPPSVQRANFARGKLWISVLNSSSATKCSVIVTQRIKRKHHITRVVAVHRTRSVGKWVGIDLSSAWSASEHSVVLEVVTPGSHEVVNVSATPILELTAFTRVERHAQHRAKRSSTCESNNQSCCMQSFVIGREDLERYFSFIIYPREIPVNFCRGSCDSGSNSISSHASAMYIRSNAEGDSLLRAQMMPCCTPKSLSDVELLIYRRDGSVGLQNVPNLRVVECGCA